MSRRGKETFNEAIVGIFMTAVILLLGYFTIVISGVDILRGDEKVIIKVTFDQVGGLKDHDNVMYRGTKVGKVESVAVTPSNLLVTASIDRNVVLRDDYRIAVCNLSMLGGNYLLLEEGRGTPVELTTTAFRGETPTDWMQDLSKIAKNVRELTEMNEAKAIVTNIALVSAKADQFMAKANKLADDVEQVIADARVVVADGRTFLSHATAAADRIESAANNVGEVAAGLNDPKMFDNLDAGVLAFRKAAESMDLTETVAKANELIVNLTEITERLKNGDGTFGRLMVDSTLYDQLNGLIKDARQILDNYRDTTPISTFSSLATGAL